MTSGTASPAEDALHVSAEPRAEPSGAPAFAPIIIEPRPGWRAVDFGELWRSRELLLFLVWRDIMVRYKQTVLGAGWAIAQPLMTMLVFTLFFGRFGGMSRFFEGPYPLAVFAGLLPWQFVSTSITSSGLSLVTSANLLKKVYFPRLIIPFAAVGVHVVDMAFAFLTMAGLMLWYGVAPGAGVLALALLVPWTILTALGAGTLLSALTVAYRDFRHMIPFLVQIWMFTSPIAYPLERIPEQYRLAYAINPMVGLVSGFRAALLNYDWHWGCMAVSACSSAAMLALGLTYFRRTERRFADIV
ncbi:MAG: ABC transporter permease [Planctomyces sp.]|nr:ABC transporter permease [Planctomyces sp.]